MGNVSWKEIIIAGWPVLSVLLICSIITLAIIFERWKVFSKIHSDSRPFLKSIRDVQDKNKIIQWCENQKQQPLALLAKSIFLAQTREQMERHQYRAIQASVQHLEKNIAFLGTIASVAPFIGLLGTVIGIIRSFQAVSMSSAGGASSVALGISEALVGTAAGLVVAIPALLGYNHFVNKMRILTQDWELCGSEIIDIALSKKD
ncbi:MAG: MotA/TolQ/ExbB proton channel family protein [Elusimicrobiota bacterium]